MLLLTGCTPHHYWQVEELPAGCTVVDLGMELEGCAVEHAFEDAFEVDFEAVEAGLGDLERTQICMVVV